MKQVNLTLLFLAVFAVSVFAQDPPIKSFKGATSKLRKYIANQEKNVEALQEAKDLIDLAVAGIDEIKTKDQPKVYNKAGEIYFEVAKQANLKAKNPDASTKSMNFLLKAADHPNAKSFNKADSEKWLQSLAEQVLLTEGDIAYKAGKNEIAFNAFENVLKCKEKITALNKNTFFLIDPVQYDNIKFFAGYTAYNAGKKAEAKSYLQPLADAGFDVSDLYSYLSKIYKEEGDNDAALAAIDKGVEVMSNVKIAEDADEATKKSEKERIERGLRVLLYDKINFYLSTKQMDKLEVELKKAIDQDKENAQLPFTLGQVYEGLSSDAYAANNEEDGDKYLESAIDYYKKTVEIKADYYDAIYQQGAIYFNSAVRVYKVQANLGMGADDQKKSKELAAQINTYYEKAWKAFQEAEKVRPNDELLIIAFKQLYLRVNNNDAYKEYKKREETVKADKKAKLEPYAGHPDALFKK